MLNKSSGFGKSNGPILICKTSRPLVWEQSIWSSWRKERFAGRESSYGHVALKDFWKRLVKCQLLPLKLVVFTGWTSVPIKSFPCFASWLWITVYSKIGVKECKIVHLFRSLGRKAENPVDMSTISEQTISQSIPISCTSYNVARAWWYKVKESI